MDYYCADDYDPLQFYFAKVVRAKKKHRCEECGASIYSGEQYERVTIKYEGEMYTITTCERCYDLRVWVKNNVPCLCTTHGNMDEEMANAIESACARAPDETIGLRFGFLRRKAARDKFNLRARGPSYSHAVPKGAPNA